MWINILFSHWQYYRKNWIFKNYRLLRYFIWWNLMPPKSFFPSRLKTAQSPLTAFVFCRSSSTFCFFISSQVNSHHLSMVFFLVFYVFFFIILFISTFHGLPLFFLIFCGCCSFTVRMVFIFSFDKSTNHISTFFNQLFLIHSQVVQHWPSVSIPTPSLPPQTPSREP